MLEQAAGAMQDVVCGPAPALPGGDSNEGRVSGSVGGVWELRLRADPRASDPPWTDGGCRVERGCPTHPQGYRYAIGVGPEAAQTLLADAHPSFAPWEPLKRAAHQHFDDLVSRARESTLALESAVHSGERVAANVDWRARIVSGGRLSAPAVSLEASFHAAVIDRKTGLTLNEFLGDPDKAVWTTGWAPSDWLAQPRRRIAALRQLPEISRAEVGDSIVLWPSAAGTWAHEMAHAAIEGLWPHERPETRVHSVVDDPTAAAWPAGFQSDAFGEPARRSVIRGDEENDVAIRRATVRDVARPSPSVTFLESECTPSTAAGDAFAIEMAAARTDPLTGWMAFEPRGLMVRQHGALKRVTHPTVITTTVDRSWFSARIVTHEETFAPLSVQHVAQCVRQGRPHAVMVGAPTVELALSPRPARESSGSR